MALKCFSAALHTDALLLQVPSPRLMFTAASSASQLKSLAYPSGRGAAASKTIPEGPQPTKARPGRANSSPQQWQGVGRVAAWR